MLQQDNQASYVTSNNTAGHCSEVNNDVTSNNTAGHYSQVNNDVTSNNTAGHCSQVNSDAASNYADVLPQNMQVSCVSNFSKLCVKIKFFIYGAILLKFETQHMYMFTNPATAVALADPAKNLVAREAGLLLYM